MEEKNQDLLAEIHVKCMRAKDDPTHMSASIQCYGSARWAIAALGLAINDVAVNVEMPAPMVAALAIASAEAHEESIDESIRIDLSQRLHGQEQRGGDNG